MAEICMFLHFNNYAVSGLLSSNRCVHSLYTKFGKINGISK